MTEGDEILIDCNESELHWMARIQGLPVLSRGIPHEELVALVSGEAKVEDRHLAATNYSRARLENFIFQNFNQVQGQLPGCNGRCRSFMCTEGKHMSCFLPSEPLLLE